MVKWYLSNQNVSGFRSVKLECHVPSLALGPIVDREAHGVHANRVVAQEEAAKVDSLDAVKHGV